MLLILHPEDAFRLCCVGIDAAEESCLYREHKMKSESRPEGLCMKLSGLHCYGSDAANKDFS